MDLLLGQLHYTSFTGRGFKQLASKQVPREVQKAFSDRIISCYWDTAHPPRLGYRAVYLHQFNCQQTLFGWLYSDRIDEKSETAVPYFICYYLNEKLLSFQLETIFVCLQKGPIAVIDKNNSSITLQQKIIPNLWNYQPARSGVVIASDICQKCLVDLTQAELINLFVPLSAQQTIILPNQQTYEQQLANLSVYQNYILEEIKERNDSLIRLNQSLTYQEIEHNQEVQLSIQVAQLEHHNSSLLVKIRESNLAIPHQNISQENSDEQALLLAEDEELYLDIMPSDHNNANFLLRIGIIATALAVVLSIYRLIQVTISLPITSEVVNNIPNFYQTLAAVPNVPQGIFNYGGSPTFAPLRSPTILSAISQAQRQFQLRFVEPVGTPQGSGAGIRMLLDGELSFALSARPLKDNELAQAQARGFTLEQIPVAIDGISFFINPSNKIVGLNLSQLQDIFSGKINNWSAVGGADLPIVVLSFDPQVSGTADVVQQRVLAGGEFGDNVQIVNTATESILKVAATPGAISYSSASVVVGQKTIYPVPLSVGQGAIFVTPFVGVNETVLNRTVFANGSYPLTRRLFVVVKRDGRLDEQAGIAYANLLSTDEGQKLIEQAGFVPIR